MNLHLRHRLAQSLCLILLFCAAVSAGAQKPPVALFYMTNSPASVRSFLAHSAKISILVPTWYSVDANGLVAGAPNPEVMRVAREQRVPVMPIITSTGKAAFHLLLGNSTAQHTLLAALIEQARLNDYMGFQFDFEDISWTDRDALSALVAESAASLHSVGLKLSIATVPNAPGYPGAGAFSRWIYADWRGAYDLKAIAKSVDLICLMTYDQHTRWTTPGPVAGWQWTLDNLTYALQFVPPQKLSLGIPLYGYHWYAGNPVVKDITKPNVTANYISEPDALLLAQEYHGTPQWDPVDHTAWFYIYRDQMREWVFYTDARTFEDRYKLAQEHGLEGFCSWVLGTEDPAIWKLLPDRR
ncbi:MAG: glycosyl hydrolase family 18 protein [Acidobacteriaceae bacterium]